MIESKSKSKSDRRQAQPKSDFVRLAERAMRKAQRVAARENARFGLPLIVQKSH